MDVLEVVCIFCCIIASTVHVKADTKSSLNYKIVEFEVLKARSRRGATGISPDAPDLEVAFKSFDKDFHLILRRDASFDIIAAEIENESTHGVNADLKSGFYEGFLGDQPTRSDVLGFLLDGSLTAAIRDDNEIYFVEPARKFLENPSMDAQKIAVYKASDVRRERWNEEDWNPSDLDELLVDYYSVSSAKEEVSGIDLAKSKEDMFCEIEMVADHTVHDYFKKDVDKVAATLYLHAKFADRVFGSTDFSMKGKPGGLRIAVRKISVYKSEKDKNYPMSGVEVPEAATNISSYLRAFSHREQESQFCLSMGTFCRPMPGQARGLTFTPDGSVEGIGHGGICDRPIPSNFTGSNGTATGYKRRYLNVGVTDLCGEDGKVLSLDASLRAFARQVAHAFGSRHDPGTKLNQSFPVEDPARSASTGGPRDFPKLSPGSRKNITDAVRLFGGCLKAKKADCGNGVREGDEACDCGPKAVCKEVDPCCSPSCTLLSKCSPKEQACCKDCSSVHPAGRVCYMDEHLCAVSFCDGYRPACPEPKKFPEAFCKPGRSELCSPDDVYCKAACLLADGLEDCFCTETFATECLRCCRRRGAGGACLPAAHLGLNASGGKPFVRMQADPCSIGFCDSAGNCVGDPNRSAMPIWMTALLPAPGVLLGVCALIAIGLFVWKHRKKLQEEEPSAAQPIVQTPEETSEEAAEETPEGTAGESPDGDSMGRMVAGGRAPRESMKINF